MPTVPGHPRACSARNCATTGPAGLSHKDLAARANVSHDVISKIETGERPPAEDFPPRLDAVPDLDTRGALTRLWDHLKKGQKQRLHGWFQEWADIEAQAKVLRWYEPLVVPGLLQTEDYARAILSARPDGNLDGLDEQAPRGWPARRCWTARTRRSCGAFWTRACCKSSYSGSNGGTCVEVGTFGPAVAVRDSNHPDAPS